jgi:hypothetical protein
VKITGGSSAGSQVEDTGSDVTPPSDSDTAVHDEDIPVQFTKVMGKGRVQKDESFYVTRLRIIHLFISDLRF